MLQAVVYFGQDGRSSNTPFINLFTVGSCPKATWVFSKHNKEDSMLLAVFIDLYDKPVLNNSARKSMAKGNGGEI